MKNIFAFLTLAMLALALTSTSALADQDNVTVDVTKLTPEQLRVYQQLKTLQNNPNAANALENLTPEKLDKYAQMGKGLGIAINEGLGAVTKNVESFSQTSAGKWLMVLITWKVMGEDAIGLARTAVQWTVGGLLLLIGIPFWIWIVRRNCVQRPIAAVEKTGFWKKKVDYRDSDPLHANWVAAYGACFLVYMGVVALITFIH